MWQLNRSTLACTKNSCAFSTRRWERPTESESFCLVNQLSYAEFKLYVYLYIFLSIYRTQVLKWSKQLRILTQALAKIFIKYSYLLGPWKKYFFPVTAPNSYILQDTLTLWPWTWQVSFFVCFLFLKQNPSSMSGKLRFFYTAMFRLPISLSLYLSTK